MVVHASGEVARKGAQVPQTTTSILSSQQVERLVIAALREVTLDGDESRGQSAFFVTSDQRNAKLTETLHVFQRRAEVIAAHVARFR